jgi:germination protein M
MKKILSVILCSVLMITLSACAKTEVKKDTTLKTTVKDTPVVATKVEPKVEPKVVVKTEDLKSREVVLYFSDDQAMNLVGVKRNIENPTAKSIVAELLKGPSSSTGNLVGTLPSGVVILDVQVKEDIAYVNFKENIRQKIGGSAGEGMALYSIIDTLVLDKELGIKKVQFLVEGKNVESITGQYDVSKPMTTNNDIKIK